MSAVFSSHFVKINNTTWQNNFDFINILILVAHTNCLKLQTKVSSQDSGGDVRGSRRSSVVARPLQGDRTAGHALQQQRAYINYCNCVDIGKLVYLSPGNLPGAQILRQPDWFVLTLSLSLSLYSMLCSGSALSASNYSTSTPMYCID